MNIIVKIAANIGANMMPCFGCSLDVVRSLLSKSHNCPFFPSKKNAFNNFTKEITLFHAVVVYNRSNEKARKCLTHHTHVDPLECLLATTYPLLIGPN